HRANPEGFRRFASVPDLPVTEIAADSVAFVVSDTDGGGSGESPSAARAASAPEWIRYNDYGIGLLLEGNLRLAAQAFERVRALRPESIEGPLNLARVALAGGDLATAYARLDEVERIRPGDARAAWVWANVLQEDGRYQDAAEAYRYVLERFPGDRAAWRNLGRTLFLDSRYEEALTALDRVLEIDPEDRIAHYHRMLALRALGRTEEARLAQLAYSRYEVDEPASALARRYLEENPGVNRMAQRIQTHPLNVVVPQR
ncbi:MAG: tetratricopeptide repeat protein, partial [Gemmatimonadetes bacterium]